MIRLKLTSSQNAPLFGDAVRTICENYSLTCNQLNERRQCGENEIARAAKLQYDNLNPKLPPNPSPTVKLILSQLLHQAHMHHVNEMDASCICHDNQDLNLCEGLYSGTSGQDLCEGL